jgi:hypothetical protein
VFKRYEEVRLNCLTIANEMFPSSSSPTLLVLSKMLPARIFFLVLVSFILYGFLCFMLTHNSLLSLPLHSTHTVNSSNRAKIVGEAVTKEKRATGELINLIPKCARRRSMRDACRQPKKHVRSIKKNAHRCNMSTC